MFTLSHTHSLKLIKDVIIPPIKFKVVKCFVFGLSCVTRKEEEKPTARRNYPAYPFRKSKQTTQALDGKKNKRRPFARLTKKKDKVLAQIEKIDRQAERKKKKKKNH